MKVSVCSNRPVLSPCGLKDIDYQVDTYIGCEHYCYYCYALPQAETDWSKEVCIHKDIVAQLEKELEGIPPPDNLLGISYGSLPTMRGRISTDPKGPGVTIEQGVFRKHSHQV